MRGTWTARSATRWAAACGVVVACGVGTGCALLTKSDSVILRYFALDSGEANGNHVARQAAPDAQRLRLRVGRINAASYLRDKIAYRSSKVEIGFYDELRWTEKPEAYVRRALGRELFEHAGLEQMVAGASPTLEVELDAFEEIRGASPSVRVEMTWLLWDDQVVAVQDTFTIERPLSGSPPSPEAIATALSGALDEAVKRIATGVVGVLSSQPDSAKPSEGVPAAPGVRQSDAGP